MVFSLSIFGQSTDSIPVFNTPKIARQTDSIMGQQLLLLDTLKNELNTTFRKNIKAKKYDIKLTLKRHFSITDSSFRSKIWSSSRSKFVPKMYSIEEVSDTQKNEGINRLKNMNFRPSLNGRIVSESYATNFLDPFTKSEAIYSRLYGSPTIEMLGLPFKLDFFYTTEDNSFYNSNYISLDFDIQKYKQNLRAKAEQKINDQIEAKKKSVQELLDVSKAEQQLKTKLENEKNKLNASLQEAQDFGIDTTGLSNKLGNVKQQQMARVHTKVNEQKDALTGNIHSKQDSLQGRFTDSLNNQVNLDSLAQEKQVLMDSIARFKQQIAEYESQYERVQEKTKQLKGLDKQIGDSLAFLRKNSSSLDFLKSKTNKYPKVSKLLDFASNIEKFQLGLTNPIFSAYTLNGVPVKGGHTIFHYKETKIELAVGKSFRSEANTFGIGQPQPTFERHAIGVKYFHKLGKHKTSAIAISSVSLFDDQTVELPKQNILHALDYTNKLSERIEVGFSLNHSILKKPNTDDVPISFGSVEETSDQRIQDFIDHFAVEGNTTIRFSKSIKLESSYKRVSPAYISLGNPFLRSNFHEFDFKNKTKLFKRKITLTTFYKMFEDNITSLSNTTNRMDGYGISARSRFKGPLNFQAQYSPYQQGNNNPDTLFRTDNQLAITSANLMYSKRLKTANLTAILTFVKSTVDYNQGSMLVNNTLYLSSTTWSSKKVNLTFNASRNLTGPAIDTLNFWGFRCGISQKNGKKVNFSFNAFYDAYDTGAIRHRSTLQTSIKLTPKLQSDIHAEYGQIENLYGIDGKNVYGCRIVLKYQL